MKYLRIIFFLLLFRGRIYTPTQFHLGGSVLVVVVVIAVAVVVVVSNGGFVVVVVSSGGLVFGTIVST